MEQPDRAADITALMNRTVPAGQMRLITLVAEQAQALGVSVYVVGGFVRDLLIGIEGTRLGKTDLDFVMETDAPAFAATIQSQYGGTVTSHSRFGTATWHIDQSVSLTTGITDVAFVDFVTARRETYPEPGMLPVVEPSTIADDLRRRDFTINAMAIRLAPDPFGTLIDPLNGERDLNDKIIRVLHDNSFIDDATRLFRAARIEQRFGFEIEAHTKALIAPALFSIARISGERLRTELDVIYRERSPERTLTRLSQLGVLQAVYSPLIFDHACERAYHTLREFPLSVDFAEAYEIILLARAENITAVEWLGTRLHLDAQRMKHLHQGFSLNQLLPGLQRLTRPSEIVTLLDKIDSKIANSVIAAVWAMTADEPTREHLLSYAEVWRDKKPTLTGHELMAMGLPQSPQIGKILHSLRMALLDGEIETPDDERTFVQKWLKGTP